MASPAISEQLSKLQSSSTSASAKASAYADLLQQIVKHESGAQLTADLKTFLDAILGESLGIILSRELLGYLVGALGAIRDPEVVIAVGQHALELQQSRVVSFEEQDACVRDTLAHAYESSGDHSAAAKVLQGVPLESSQRTINNDYKLRLLIRIVRNYLEDDNTLDADVYLNRAKALLHLCDDRELKLMYQLSHARILDAQRKFLDASREYHDLSFSAVVVDEERMRALSSAIKCTVLAPAGPQRSRFLARLYKDGRASQIPEYGILEKMFLDRLITPAEVESFASTLAEHQLARTADGLTVLEKAVTEHNLVGASKVYEDIRFDELGALLGQSPRKAEDFAAQMIEQGRLTGWIDQVDGTIHFVGAAAVDGHAAPDGNAKTQPAWLNHGAAASALWKWDVAVQVLALEVEKVSGAMMIEFPVRIRNLPSSLFARIFLVRTTAVPTLFPTRHTQRQVNEG